MNPRMPAQTATKHSKCVRFKRIKVLLFLLWAFSMSELMGSELTTAIEKTNTVLARQLIVDKKQDINTPDVNGFTPLMWAASKGNIELCKILIENGAIVDTQWRYGQTIIDLINGDFGIKLDLDARRQILGLLRKAQEEQKGKEGRIAPAKNNEVYKARIDKIKEDIKNHDFTQINTSDEKGGTPLLFAVMAGDVELCKLLIKNGAIDKKDKFGMTIYDFLREGSAFGLDMETRIQIMELFKDAKKEQIRGNLEKDVSSQINTQDKSGRTLLMEVAFDGNIGACKYLLENGANPLIKDKAGKTAVDHVRNYYFELSAQKRNELIDMLRQAMTNRTKLN